MHVKTLRNWSAKRASTQITVTGIDVATGKETKIMATVLKPGWTTIEKRTFWGGAAWDDAPCTHAVDKDNVHHILLPLD